MAATEEIIIRVGKGVCNMFKKEGTMCEAVNFESLYADNSRFCWILHKFLEEGSKGVSVTYVCLLILHLGLFTWK